MPSNQLDKLKEIAPQIGQDFYLQAKVVRVWFVGDNIHVRLIEYTSQTRFTLIFKQQMLPGVDDATKEIT